jgi:hypothetical protein
MNKITTTVWCVDSDAAKKNEQIGEKIHDEGDRWLAFAFDLDEVRNIKEAGTNEFISHGEASVITFSNGDNYTVRMGFSELYYLWIKKIKA